ncbi:uncharacterized protein LOC108623343 [Ceratina calcarata]|uniref:Cilia- and flagella-associated protein 157 n=1 Tax=Ceratina calcarata TaxID=156304 RepID=A0AAJ7RYB0_9HYME|nr:uncharacterized protein LOC108623343 [Ceratina calcarata]
MHTLLFGFLFPEKMVDLQGKDKGNISLPEKLQSYESAEDPRQKGQPTIINTQRAFYDIKVADIDNKIHRLEDRNEELLQDIENASEVFAAADAETAEEIENLKKQLTAQTNSLENLKERISTLEQSREDDKQSLEHKIKLFDEKYKKKKVELVSQLKVLNARINVLDDFKKVQKPLGEKLKENEELMVENEKKMKETMLSIDRRIEFDKEILKNEMYDCLLDLAAQFQVETNKHISKPNQRLMRENIMLKNELLVISDEVDSKMEAQVDLKINVVEHRRKIDEETSFFRRKLVIAKVQEQVLQHLKKKLQKAKDFLSTINIPDPGAEEKYLLLIDKAREEEHEAKFQFSSMKALLHKERTKLTYSGYILRRLECKIKALVETIYDLKYTVICLLKYPSARKDLITLSCIELFIFLRDILVKGESKFRSYIIRSSESIPRELESVTDIAVPPEGIDFEIKIDFKKESVEGSTKKTEESTDVEEEKEISTESGMTPDIDIGKDIGSILDLQMDYELFEDVEYEGESLLDVIDE